MLTFEIFSLDDNYLDWMITTQLDDNYQEVVIIQWYCSYHPVLSFDVWLHWNRITIITLVQLISHPCNQQTTFQQGNAKAIMFHVQVPH